jgi:hypothetical protein
MALSSAIAKSTDPQFRKEAGNGFWRPMTCAFIYCGAKQRHARKLANREYLLMY